MGNTPSPNAPIMWGNVNQTTSPRITNVRAVFLSGPKDDVPVHVSGDVLENALESVLEGVLEGILGTSPRPKTVPFICHPICDRSRQIYPRQLLHLYHGRAHWFNGIATKPA